MKTEVVVNMSREDKHLLHRIAELKEIVRRKYKRFKTGIVETEKSLEKQYKPIINEIKNVDFKTKTLNIKKENNIPNFKSETLPIKTYKQPFDYDTYETPNITKNENIKTRELIDTYSLTDEVNLPHTSSQFNVNVESLDPDDVYETSDNEEQEQVSAVSKALGTPEGISEASQFITTNFNHPITQKYMLKLMKDVGGSKASIDHLYGPRFEKDVLMVGNKPIEFDSDGSIIVGGTSYRPTKGLYELLFKRLPDEEEYNESDLKAYRDLLLNTSAHKKNYKFNERINRNNSLKYKQIIEDLFPKQYYGKGMLTKTLGKTELIYWNDPNELVNRLRLLVASTLSGNTSHRNEILSIIEELREGNYIKGSGNALFRSLLK